MERTVWKFRINLDDYTVLYMPKGAMSLSVQMQGEDIVLYALVTLPVQDDEQERRTFRLAGTGHPIELVEDEWLDFIGTVMYHHGLVFHLFEVL